MDGRFEVRKVSTTTDEGGTAAPAGEAGAHIGTSEELDASRTKLVLKLAVWTVPERRRPGC